MPTPQRSEIGGNGLEIATDQREVVPEFRQRADHLPTPNSWPSHPLTSSPQDALACFCKHELEATSDRYRAAGRLLVSVR